MYFDGELYMFRTDLLPVSGSLSTVCAAVGVCRASCVDCLVAGSGWNWFHPDLASGQST